MSRYDLVLGLIPGAYVVGLLATAALSVSLPIAMIVASVIAAIGLADALVFHPPSTR